jgi:tRNA dimethylallyltransferase
MTPTNRRRIVRALEVTIGSGRPFSSYGPGLGEYPATAFCMVGLRLGRDELRARLAARLGAQLAAGLLDEVRRLLEAPGGVSRTARQALGYRELIAHIEQGVPLQVATAEALRRTQLFAKRQEAWFGRDPRIRWFDADRPDLVEAVVALAESDPAVSLAGQESSVHSRSRDHQIRDAIGTPAGRSTP